MIVACACGASLDLVPGTMWTVGGMKARLGEARAARVHHGGAGGGDDDTPQCQATWGTKPCIFVDGPAHPQHHQTADGGTWVTPYRGGGRPQ